jgi:hypothetical protein
MRITPISDQDLAVMGLIPEGEYSFEVQSAEDTQSKSGNDMIKLVLCVWDAEGRQHTVYDYLLEAMPKKLKHFARHCGLITKYEAGELLADDCVGKCGTLSLVIQEDKTGKYPPRNSVANYLEKKDFVCTQSDVKEDDVPFIDDQDLPF